MESLHCIEEASPGSKNFWISKNNKEQGFKGERFCQDWLTSQGFCIIRHNWRTPHGEVDLVASKDGTVFIFEIKTRSSWIKGKTSLISWKQRQRLHQSATWIWQCLRKEYKYFKCRILVVTRGNIEIENLPLLYDSN